MDNRLLKIEEVALLVGSSVQTVNMWYRFKKAEPDNEYAKMLPDFKQETPRGIRLWNYDDIYKLIQFKSSIPQGRNGVLGKITQKYIRKKKGAKNDES